MSYFNFSKSSGILLEHTGVLPLNSDERNIPTNDMIGEHRCCLY
jgi:hypothetical protein